MEFPIEGTATFERVDISTSGTGTIEVAGYYMGERATVYSATQVDVEGLRIEGSPDGQLVLEKPDAEDEWIWVVAGEEVLSIHSEKPDSVEE